MEDLSYAGDAQPLAGDPGDLPTPAEVSAAPDRPAIAPVSRQDRISAVDAIRGFSLLGILLLNIVSFGQAHWAYGNPHVIGGSNPLNIGVWSVMWILADGKMRAIFSMLFGAGVILLTSRAEERGGGAGIADIYTRRNLWLLLFGMLHCYLSCWRTFLLVPALTGLIFLYPMRKMSAKALLITGAIVALIMSPRGYFQSHSIVEARQKNDAAVAAEKAGKKLTKEQEEAAKSWAEMEKDMFPDQKAIEEENNEVRAGFFSNVKVHAKWAPKMESLFYYKGGVCDVLGMMLLGMGLLKLGFLSAQRSCRVRQGRHHRISGRHSHQLLDRVPGYPQSFRSRYHGARRLHLRYRTLRRSFRAHCGHQRCSARPA